MDAVAPPSHLPEGAIPDWNTVTADLASRQLLNEAMLTSVEMYVTAMWIMRECRTAIQRDGLFVKGAGGALKSHPASSNLQKAQETVTRLAVELGLTPSSRSRKGIGGPDKPRAKSGVEDFL